MGRAAAAALLPAARPAKLRVGVFADTRRQPRWLAGALARAARSPHAEVVVVGIGGAAARPRPRRLLEAYRRLDAWAFGPEPSDPVDLADAVPHELLLEGGGWGARELAPLGLDVAFALGGFDDARLDGAAALGVWRYDCDGFAEVADGRPLTGARLLARLDAGAPPRIAYESWSRTYPLSVARNRRDLLYKASQFAERALREAQRSGRPWLEQCPVFCNSENRGQSPISSDAPADRRSPGNRALTPIFGGNRALTPIFRIGGRILWRGVEKALGIEQWFLAFRIGAAEDALPPADLAGFRRLMPPKDRDWADPFAIEKGGRWYVFFEELVRAEGRAHIAVLEIDAEGRCSQPAVALARDYHLSYPFLLEHDGELYMLPETAENGTVELYRCTDFPRGWKLERVLLDGVRLVDPTLHREAGRWWLFANAAPGESAVFDDELHLFHADSLAGPWRPHARNPVRSDARCARPAGRLFRRDGARYRPAQICVPRYGAGLALHRVRRLSPHEYAERQVARLLPPGDALLGLHTLNRAGHLTVVDGFTRRPRI